MILDRVPIPFPYYNVVTYILLYSSESVNTNTGQ